MVDKEGVMFLLKYLYDNTDDAHPVSSSRLQDMLVKKGYPADKRTIGKYVASLREAGFDIISEGEQGKATRYFYGAHDLDRYELRILIDAVSSARFITTERTGKIIRKLANLSVSHYRKSLTPRVYVSEHIKAKDNKLLLVLEKVAEAIEGGKKIAFRYYSYTVKKERVHRHRGEVYILSPYATIWKDDRYYLVGWSEKRDDIVRFRVDRMAIPEVLEEEAVPAPEDFRIQDYADKFTKMYGGREEKVSLRCRSEMMDQIIDKFGLGVEISDVTPEAFTATATVAVGGTFLAWAFQYAGQMVIQGPESVKELYADMLKTARNDLTAGEFTENTGRQWKL